MRIINNISSKFGLLKQSRRILRRFIQVELDTCGSHSFIVGLWLMFIEKYEIYISWRFVNLLSYPLFPILWMIMN